MNLPTLEFAIEWASERWANQRAVPIRLHTRDEEGTGLMRDRKGCTCLACTPGPSESSLGSHAHSRAFEVALDGHSNLSEEMGGPTDCYHPLLKGYERARDCPECFGLGIKIHSSVRFVYPMTRALDRLRLAKNSAPRQPHPYAIVLALASHGWLPEQTARALGISWDRAEALFLIAIRKLFDRYEEGPVTVSSSWVDLSESTRNAIEAGETAA